ncbi:uncharacterized protein OCT59_027522 [Rhizophagus irregularis]|uniref:Ion transport domain-containing protein n=8 Tax=Rhizophagus irregularis TaxID=588596 RepID=A0A916E6L1_9GLOM|nr:hypothetical protein OCT59_027522 [Rhizophagus irregularis]GBC44893.1 hypothetical protein GLOIN_2v101819 [Rhizophagus irregularis DAOM 181602=DAOM 197198]CAB4479128.1 unnamed protein product [Rhizophagus irregularis]CAB5363269.1 unnamed protein product [Rhizophagus irregularis]
MDILYETSKDTFTGSVSGVGNIENSDKKLYPTHHVAVSPNGRQVATFNSATLELNICQVDSLFKQRPVNCEALDEIRSSVSSVKLVWSLAVSNPINIIQMGNNVQSYSDTLIALSCFDESEMMLGKSVTNSSMSTIAYNQSSDDLENEKNHPTYDEEKGVKGVNSTTFIISTLHSSRILTAIDDSGGLVRFLNDDPLQPQTVTIVVVNANGISKTFFDLDNIVMSNNVINNENNNNSWLNIFSSSSQLQQFYFPLKIQAELEKLYQNTPCLELLSRSIENDYFLIEDYKDRVQVVEMYNLRTDKLEMVFHQRAESAVTAFGHGNPAVAISKHNALLAYCRGANSITIYLIENSLEISTQSFPRVERILSVDFINDDESLIIIAQEKESLIPLIIVWDLFSYMDNAIRILQDATELFSSGSYKLVRSCGNIILAGSDGSVTSVLDHTLVKEILVPTIKSKKGLITLDVKYLRESEWDLSVHHTIFYQDGERDNAETKPVIVFDKEPWIHSKGYARISAFLDDERTTQLFIGVTTVQVWYRKDVNAKEQLKYIWVAPKDKKISIESLKIGQREFEVCLHIKSNQSMTTESVLNLHWPFEVNAVNHACSALWHLYDRRDDPAGLQKQQEYENLVHRTERLIRQFIKKRPAIWRLIDVRYDVMASLIKGRRIRLIQKILNNEESNPWMRYLHTPRLNEWPKKQKTSDLEIAIKCSEGRRQRDAVMVGFLLDYYSDNAMDNTGWMFTVSCAVPLLFDHHLDSYAKDLFSKPIFGMKEIHLDESHINPNDLPQGKLRYIKAFNPNTRLEPKEKPISLRNLRKFKILQPIANIIDKSKTSITHNQQLVALQKVIPGLGRGDSSALVALRSVPLPDFTVYPQGTKSQELNPRNLPFQLLRILFWPRGYAIKKESNLSPFLRVVRKDKDGMIFDNPAMEAVIDFKWEYARSHFLRHALLFVCFALLFAVLTGALKNSFVVNNVRANANNEENVHIRAFVKLLIFTFYYLGYYLLASEIVQFYHEGWRRYISVYNFFDLASIIMPLAAYTVTWVRESRGTVPINQVQQSTVAMSFTILVLWIEMFLLLRYFAVTGNFIYIIINIVRNVWPFIAFMGIVVLAHGHAMYLLLREPEKIGLEPDGTQFDLQDNNGIKTGTIHQTFDLNKATDNYFANFAQSVVAVYFWINGRWDQLQQWNFWPVSVLSLIASVILVIIMQNMLIAFMSGVFDEAKSEGRLAVLKYRSDLIAEYEILEKPFGDTKGNPRHIFYLGNINKLTKWLRKCEEYWKLRESSTKEKFYDYNKYYDDNNDKDNEPSKEGWDITGLDVDVYDKKNIKSMNRKSRIEFYSSWSTSTADSDENIETSQKSSTNKKVNFKNDDLSETTNVISPMIEDASSIQSEIVSLKDSIKTIEGSIGERLNLLEGRLAEMLNVLNKLAAGTGNV